jgi:DNA-binding IclR family transcriptional regulator
MIPAMSPSPDRRFQRPEPVTIDGDTPTLRLFSLLEVIARKNHFFTLPALVEETGLPKPTLHRMLQQLESAGMIQREADGRHYGMALRLRQLGEDLLFNSTVHGARHAVLRTLVDEVGESCNITALSGSDVLYLDRVETPAPLRFYLHPGSRVPVHCSASGKLFLAQMPDAQRRRLLDPVKLECYTPNTITDRTALESEIAEVRTKGYALDREEFLPGLLCIAVLVPAPEGRQSNTGIAIQAPVMRLSLKQVPKVLPALQRAARAMAAIDAEAVPGDAAAWRLTTAG